MAAGRSVELVYLSHSYSLVRTAYDALLPAHTYSHSNHLPLTAHYALYSLVLTALLTAHCALLTTYYSLLTPYSLLLAPHSSLPTPHSSLLTPHSSLLPPHSSLLTPHSSLLTTRYPLPATRHSLLTSKLSSSRILFTYGNLLTDVQQPSAAAQLSLLAQRGLISSLIIEWTARLQVVEWGGVGWDGMGGEVLRVVPSLARRGWRGTTLRGSPVGTFSPTSHSIMGHARALTPSSPHFFTPSTKPSTPVAHTLHIQHTASSPHEDCSGGL